MSETTLLLTIVGTGIGAAAVVVTFVAIVANGLNGRLGELAGSLGARIDKTNDRIDALRREVREDHAGLDARLRDVQVGFAKVDQRLETVERAVLPQAPPAV